MDLKAILGREVETFSSLKKKSKSASPQTIEDVRKKFADGVDKQLEKFRKEDFKRAWFQEESEGVWKVSLKYGVNFLSLNGGNYVGPFKKKDVPTVLQNFKGAALKGELDKELKEAWDKSKKAGAALKKRAA